MKYYIILKFNMNIFYENCLYNINEKAIAKNYYIIIFKKNYFLMIKI